MIKYFIIDVFRFVKYNNPYKMLQRYFFVKKYYKTEVIYELNLDTFNDFELYTVAFNNSKVIEYQILLLKKYLKDDFFHIIVDNSNNEDESDIIKNICIKNNVWYIKLPPNILFCSLSHWLALNYICKNYLKKRNTKYVWFLDHDIFPVKNCKIIDILKNQKLYWYLINKNNRKYIYWNQWMLWPWFAFFDYTKFNKFNFFVSKWFFPKPYALDTWWWNYKIIFNKIKSSNLVFPNVEIFWLTLDNEIKKVMKSEKDKFQIIFELIWNDEWFHKWWTFVRDENDESQVYNLKSSLNTFFKILDKYLYEE